jgi:hypothetical protein
LETNTLRVIARQYRFDARLNRSGTTGRRRATRAMSFGLLDCLPEIKTLLTTRFSAKIAKPRRGIIFGKAKTPAFADRQIQQRR